MPQEILERAIGALKERDVDEFKYQFNELIHLLAQQAETPKESELIFAQMI